jgi:lipopolysaccharide biosynthesis protein
MYHEIVKICRTIQRRWKDPDNNEMGIWRMSWYYLLRKFSDLSTKKVLIQVPFETVEVSSPSERIAVIVHCFYPNLLNEILDHISFIPAPYHLYISTDTYEKRGFIAETLKNRGIGKHEIRLAVNRGRDIAPKYITFRDVYSACDYFVHLHSKKSGHGGEGRGDLWRRQLLRSLLGSSDIVRSILAILKDPRIGLVFPDPFDPTIASLRWSKNYEVSLALANRLGIKISKRHCPEYPAGSMFWGKASIVRPLLDLNLQFEDFPPETGQLDGELQHALERMVVPIANAQNLYGLRIVTRDFGRRHKALRLSSAAQLPDAISTCMKNDDFEAVPLA